MCVCVFLFLFSACARPASHLVEGCGAVQEAALEYHAEQHPEARAATARAREVRRPLTGLHTLPISGA